MEQRTGSPSAHCPISCRNRRAAQERESLSKRLAAFWMASDTDTMQGTLLVIDGLRPPVVSFEHDGG